MSFSKLILTPNKQHIPITNSPNNTEVAGLCKGRPLTLEFVIENLPDYGPPATLQLFILSTFGIPIPLILLPRLARNDRHGASLPMNVLEVGVEGYRELRIRFAVAGGGDDMNRTLRFGRVFVRLMVGGKCLHEGESGECVVLGKRLQKIPLEVYERNGGEPNGQAWDFHLSHPQEEQPIVEENNIIEENNNILPPLAPPPPAPVFEDVRLDVLDQDFDVFHFGAPFGALDPLPFDFK